MVKVMRSLVRGPLAPYVAGFAAELLGQGYTRSSAEQHVCFVAHLDRWLVTEGLRVHDLDVATVQRYLSERRASGYVLYLSAKAMRPLLGYLAPLKVLPAEPPPELDAVEGLLSRYRDYLLCERGLSPGTVEGYVHLARPFLVGRLRDGELDLAGLTAAEVVAFVLATCPGRPTGSAKLIVTSTRSLLDWLHLAGVVEGSLASAVPAVAGWKLSGLPQALTAPQLRSLLASCDRRRPTGRRDYAIVLLLARLGLRSGEVAGLGLDDVDWRAGQLHVVGKGNRGESLPLPADVGAAIAAYLRRGRPASAAGRSVFVRVHAPHRALTAGGVGNVVNAAGQRAGLGHVHAHQLRHSAATAMLRAGTPLVEVGQVLRHRSPVTTAIYAKVDQDALAVLARPWPTETNGGVS
ncbi:site-specific integrase [Nocardioides aurantiacus]|uniref:site-specific integrase n=1 Tax=Nocardioides aurantiacus TaxID=86796 RepID=UPI00403FA1A7